ncbi:MAG TPA: TetR/AcrR family transcriptional regulator [Edaphobacter sp.]|nr:TetR/AcrR family transcriptional regulator [Edaphobacter sp.]
MPRVSTLSLEPRKSPVQARSNASVQAICEATIQVLLALGKERLTTRKVAERAGVSVGTLYQYFPNKSSLLQAVLRSHLEQVTCAVEKICSALKGASLDRMAEGLVGGFLEAKLKRVEISRALYFVSDDVRGAEIVRQFGARNIKAIAAMLESSEARFAEDMETIASTLMAAMAGVSRRMLESDLSPKTLATMRDGLRVMVRAYLNACAEGTTAD